MLLAQAVNERGRQRIGVGVWGDSDKCHGVIQAGIGASGRDGLLGPPAFGEGDREPIAGVEELPTLKYALPRVVIEPDAVKALEKVRAIPSNGWSWGPLDALCLLLDVGDPAFTLTMHPQYIGRPGRLLMLERLIEHIRTFPNVEFMRAVDVAEMWRVDVTG